MSVWYKYDASDEEKPRLGCCLYKISTEENPLGCCLYKFTETEKNAVLLS
jgi:hypothetical protein